jgi:hypothetical protein
MNTITTYYINSLPTHLRKYSGYIYEKSVHEERISLLLYFKSIIYFRPEYNTNKPIRTAIPPK